MPVSDCELTQMFEHVLTLSKVDPTQSVAVLKSHYSDPRTVRAAMDAAQRLGAKVYAVELPAFNHPRAMGNDMTAYCGDTALTGNIAAQRALEAADLIVDTMMLLHSPEQEQILKTGTRILLAVEPRKCWRACCPPKQTRCGYWRPSNGSNRRARFTSNPVPAVTFVRHWGNTRQ